jgi:hypothetical protein
LKQLLSPAADAAWEAFNQDEAGVFVDDGDKLAAAFVAVAPYLEHDGQQLLKIARELEGKH